MPSFTTPKQQFKLGGCVNLFWECWYLTESGVLFCSVLRIISANRNMLELTLHLYAYYNVCTPLCCVIINFFPPVVGYSISSISTSLDSQYNLQAVRELVTTRIDNRVCTLYLLLCDHYCIDHMKGKSKHLIWSHGYCSPIL